MPVAVPYRLDLTVSALRRLPNNLVDVYTRDGRYLRALGGLAGPTIVCVTQQRADALSVTIDPSTAIEEPLMTVRRMLGADRDVADFTEHAQRIPWLAPLVRRMRGIKSPRYPGLWEACVNAIVFQHVSIHAATAIMGRLTLALGDRAECDGVPLIVFPTAERLLSARDGLMRATGLSAVKCATLRRVGEAIIGGALSEAMLEPRSSADAATLLCGIKGIGPWTAAVILLRGLGRLDIFPGDDSGVAKSLTLVAGRQVNADHLAEMLGSQRGMLYFCLLVARLEARGELGSASDVAR